MNDKDKLQALEFIHDVQKYIKPTILTYGVDHINKNLECEGMYYDWFEKDVPVKLTPDEFEKEKQLIHPDSTLLVRQNDMLIKLRNVSNIYGYE